MNYCSRRALLHPQPPLGAVINGGCYHILQTLGPDELGTRGLHVLVRSGLTSVVCQGRGASRSQSALHMQSWYAYAAMSGSSTRSLVWGRGRGGGGRGAQGGNPAEVLDMGAER